jgi:5'-deoxynucleotidase YfbR-like HD superfamily hydrolase
MFNELYPDNKTLLGTRFGKMIDLLDPQPEDILIEDIAHQLTNHCRFGGAIKSFYSVAEHSILVCDLCNIDKLSGLLHDASEAYLCDIPTPLKKLLPEYLKIEDRFMRVIADKFNFKYPLSDEVKEADKKALEIEYEKLILNKKNNSNVIIKNNSFSDFLEKFWKLK